MAEKRTSLAAMRTGIAMLVLPLSVMSLLIATSRYYDFLHVLYFLVALGVVNLALIILGGYLIVRAIIRIHNYVSIHPGLPSAATLRELCLLKFLHSAQIPDPVI
ncbi:MAG: hypothetical protein U5J82_15715 [Desulfobacterales bacterium]|nr:hypothetical protein [Desulfobacterales bacterium]